MSYYYLHTNGDLIYKRFDPGEDNSDFVRRVWKIDTTNRIDAWTIIVEALALGANLDRVKELANHWHCDLNDFEEYISRHVRPTKEQQRGAAMFLEKVAGVNPNNYWDTLKTRK